ncbi:hypothetical protein B0T22DRAFT_102354 [Podospora appendiculata]|uniref:Uncharacterized protein n=1 Tax=Podospora appendiculata TaxID=314037 RepID=A0AAE0XKX5_9PEZI|nr:hypothetical protein B0T22DRAFT_102354 [Podospora appendiculata]
MVIRIPSGQPTPTFRCDSPDADMLPKPAIGKPAEPERCVSIASSFSHGSATTEASNTRESLGSDISAFSRQSSGSYNSPRLSTGSHALRSRQSTGSLATTCTSPRSSSQGATTKRRGFMRPLATDFAASARSRESVLSLGSIAHLQYYFARTGLLDGKGGQFARKRQQKAHTLDLSSLESSSFMSIPRALSGDYDSSYASMGSSPDLGGQGGFGKGFLGTGSVVYSPIDSQSPGLPDEEYYSDDSEENEMSMLPPTTSTYRNRQRALSKPPTISELKSRLRKALNAAATSLNEAREAKANSPGPASPMQDTAQPPSPRQESDTPPGWFEIQGMHILDVMTLAIQAAKKYYTAHDQPDRLDAIKPEKEIRSELLHVMDVLKRMAARGFAGGIRYDEFDTMDAWIIGLRAMMETEDAIDAKEAVERAGWTWLSPVGWEGREFAREEAFMRSMLEGSADPVEGMPPLPPWTPIDRNLPLVDQPLPTPFLAALQNGQRLVQLHNCAVRKSRQRFGTIGTFHADTQKPYRAADNLRYWIKAAELRWEVLLKADALGIQYNTGPEVWVQFEDAILRWCRKVREEITAELKQAGQAVETLLV